jgi:hypothetical protein
VTGLKAEEIFVYALMYSPSFAVASLDTFVSCRCYQKSLSALMYSPSFAVASLENEVVSLQNTILWDLNEAPL